MTYFKFNVLLSINCGICGETAGAKYYAVAAGCEIPLPDLPDGWRVLDGLPICHKHSVTVKSGRKSK